MTQTQKMINLLKDIDSLAAFNVKSVTLRKEQYQELCNYLGVRSLRHRNGISINSLYDSADDKKIRLNKNQGKVKNEQVL